MTGAERGRGRATEVAHAANSRRRSRKSSSQASTERPPGDIAERGDGLLLLACGAILLLALIFGGTREVLWPDAVVQIASLPLLGYALWQVPGIWRRANNRLALSVLVAVVALPLVQLIPLPPFIWTSLPGRASIVSAYREAALEVPWLGISLNPAATWRDALTLIPPVAIFLSTLLLGRGARRILAAGFVAFAFISVLLGLAQIAQSEAVGFFANRNHFAALLYSALPLTAAFAVGFASDRRREIWIVLALCLLVFASLLLGLGMSRSRAGVGIAMFAGLGSLALAVTTPRPDTRKRANRWVWLAAFAGVVLVLQFASIGLLQRFEVAPEDDLRWEFAATTLRAALDFMPFGSGFGTFEDVYKIYEERGQLFTSYVNHAHNEYAETLLEGGVPAFGVLIAFLIWFATAATRRWRATGARSMSTLDRSLPKAATLVVLLLLIHSAVDYPLRTTALSALFAFACALMIAPRSGSRSGLGADERGQSLAEPSKRIDERRHHSTMSPSRGQGTTAK